MGNMKPVAGTDFLNEIMVALQGTSRLASAALLFFPFLFSGTFCRGANGDKGSPADAVRLFSGRWDLTLKRSDRVEDERREFYGDVESGRRDARQPGTWSGDHQRAKVPGFQVACRVQLRR